jgi:hypothetical protein
MATCSPAAGGSRAGDGGGIQLARLTGDHELVATWTRTKSLGNADAEGDAQVWQQTLAVLHIPTI